MGIRASKAGSAPAALSPFETEHAVAAFEGLGKDPKARFLAIECRTTNKDSQEIAVKRYLVSSEIGHDVSVGSSSENHIVLDDPNVADSHAKIRIGADGVVSFEAISRSYRMLPPPDAFGADGWQLQVGQVIKMGACSVEVTAIQLPEVEGCTSSDTSSAWSSCADTDEHTHRAAASASADAGAGAGAGAASSSRGKAASAAGADQLTVDPAVASRAFPTSATSSQVGSPRTTPTAGNSTASSVVGTRANAAASPATVDPVAAAAAAVSRLQATDSLMMEEADATQQSDDQQSLEQCDKGASASVNPAATAVAASSAAKSPSIDLDEPVCYICMCPATEEQDLITSPCSCSATVHKHCLKKWVETKGSRNCSICKTRLPLSATVDAPFMVFQVIRHMRGLQWNGEREYILPFATRQPESSRPSLVLGSHNSCDIRLPDPSMSKQHALITYDRELERFELKDLRSRAGTFLRVMQPVTVATGALVKFKFARTTLSMETGTWEDIQAAAMARRIAQEEDETAAAAHAALNATAGATVTVSASAMATIGVDAPGSNGVVHVMTPTGGDRPVAATGFDSTTGGGEGTAAPAAGNGAASASGGRTTGGSTTQTAAVHVQPYAPSSTVHAAESLTTAAAGASGGAFVLSRVLTGTLGAAAPGQAPVTTTTIAPAGAFNRFGSGPRVLEHRDTERS